MAADVIVDTGATAPVHMVRSYQNRIGAPPLLEDAFRSLVPVGNQTATAPVQLGRSNRYMILKVDGPSIISIPTPLSAADQIAAAKSALQGIDSIKTDLALSITQLAELLGVTRKTVYDWYDGSMPRSSILSRIYALQLAISEVARDIEVSRLKTVWKIEGASRSFLAILHDDGMEETILKTALVDKINELSSRLVSMGTTKVRTTHDLGKAHLAEFERHAHVG